MSLRRLRLEHGIGKLTLLVFGVLAGALLYSAYHILPFYYYYLELQSHMEQAIKVADVDTDEEIRKKLIYQIRWMNIPADEKKLRIERGDHFMRISLPYEEIFYVPWQGEDRDLYVFKFVAKAEGKF